MSQPPSNCITIQGHTQKVMVRDQELSRVLQVKSAQKRFHESQEAYSAIAKQAQSKLFSERSFPSFSL